MSKAILNNRTLFSYHQQIEQMRRNNSIMEYLLRGGVDKFYHENRQYLNTLFNHVQRLEEHFFEIENGKPKMAEDKPVFLEGKTEYSFNKNWEVLMNLTAGKGFKIEDYIEPVTDEQKQEAEATTEA